MTSTQEQGGRNREAEQSRAESGVTRRALDLSLQYIDYGDEFFEPNLRERLKQDWDNKTMDYSRMNYLEVFAMFNCDVPNAVTHWRIGKILDGMNVCSDQLKIFGGIGFSDVPKKIYPMLKDGRGDEKVFDVKVKNPNTGEEEEKKVSLADFAHLVDVIKMNRELVTDKFDLDELVYNYFVKKGGLSRVIKQTSVDDGGHEIEKDFVVDLLDNTQNPRDDYKTIDIDAYFDRIKDEDVQIGLQLMAEWRGSSDGHREMAGHSLQMAYGSGPDEVAYIPLSGRLAEKITMSDLLKQEKNGMNGQPQEIAECDEEANGTFVRFSLHDLTQRRRGGDIRNVQKTQRMAKAMVGITLTEVAGNYVETEIDATTKKEKKKVYIGGKNLEGNAIAGIKARYDESVKRIRGRGLTSKEAADVMVTDILIPCIINNPNDWLTAVATTYGVGGSKGGQSLLNNREVFQDFEIWITGRNMDKDGGPIEKMCFRGFNELMKYVSRRVSAGHIDQAGAKNLVSKAQESLDSAKPGDEFTIGDKQPEVYGPNIHKILSSLLGAEAREFINKYINKGSSAEFRKWPAGLNKQDPQIPPELKDLDLSKDFDCIVSILLNEKYDEVSEDLENLFSLDDIDRENKDIIITAFIRILGEITPEDRKKIKP
ncbi:MAG: hypothetical protein UR53_C0003G0009 [Candidatus Magasanikbacteria bacterium GW2011_GWC2_34_16]|uniref:Uncharacterized protein n=2 Tax=Candidatus Magasanikiibacteriota TaxID=1752731 RepID=A0A0G0HRQ3_9BACT|nr:MAG: hypothetical protein UR53_C0003G0009 [Candidatus Magasanikbacteria bacterium GW2011_GWC2_34_16]KKQ41285.1 MAG: hypothetical protein US58_C0002G0008 [Candidatus Magasanikbacteria bacterium GW2011_GWA2_37_8]